MRHFTPISILSTTVFRDNSSIDYRLVRRWWRTDDNSNSLKVTHDQGLDGETTALKPKELYERLRRLAHYMNTRFERLSYRFAEQAANTRLTLKQESRQVRTDRNVEPCWLNPRSWNRIPSTLRESHRTARTYCGSPFAGGSGC